jgi:hypothetical protein
MTIELDELSYDELLDLNDRVIARLKHLEATDTLNAMMKFNLGTKVCFDSSRHGMQTGTIIKFNPKTVVVLTDEGHRWKISPQMLSPLIKEAAGELNVIDMKKKKFDPS